MGAPLDRALGEVPATSTCDQVKEPMAYDYDIVVIGGPEESALARAIQKKCQARDLTGRTDFAHIARRHNIRGKDLEAFKTASGVIASITSSVK